jgi:hypothetical protein
VPHLYGEDALAVLSRSRNGLPWWELSTLPSRERTCLFPYPTPLEGNRPRCAVWRAIRSTRPNKRSAEAMRNVAHQPDDNWLFAGHALALELVSGYEERRRDSLERQACLLAHSSCPAVFPGARRAAGIFCSSSTIRTYARAPCLGNAKSSCPRRRIE